MKRLFAVAVSLLLTALLSGNAVGAEDRSRYETKYPHSWFDGSEPGMPVWDSNAGAFRPQKTDKRKQIFINERFVVPKGKTKTFYNKIVWMRAKSDKEDDLEVYGKLRFINCLILWDQKFPRQNELRIKKGGSLFIKNSYAVIANSNWVYWEFESGSKVEFNRFASQYWTTIHGSVRYTAKNFSTAWLTFLPSTKNSRVVILNAHSVYFEIFPPGGSKFTIRFPKKKKWENWSLNSVWPKTKVIVRNSYIWENDISLSNNVHATVKNSTEGFNIGWAVWEDDQDGPVNCILKGLGNPKNKKGTGTYYRRKVWRLPCNNSSLTVINSKLDTAWPNIWTEGTFKIYNSNLHEIMFGGGAKMEIYNSTLTFGKPTGDGSGLYLHNVKIRRDDRAAGLFPTDLAKIYGYKVRAEKRGDKVKIVETDGGKYIKLTSPGPPW